MLGHVPAGTNRIVETHSRLAKDYDDEMNVRSCWGIASESALATIRLGDDCRVAVDVGCGTGRALARLARPSTELVGIDPAENMLRLATQRTSRLANARVLCGCFEQMPLKSRSVDYLFSLFAFHWTTDPAEAVKELARVLKPHAEMDLFFIGRNNGREFIKRTTPIFLRYMGPELLLRAARMRTQLTRDEVVELFSRQFDPTTRLSVDETYQTYYDTLEGHWAWWVRIEGQLVEIPVNTRLACDHDVRQALSSLAEPRGIPYTIHQLRVRLKGAC